VVVGSPGRIWRFCCKDELSHSLNKLEITPQDVGVHLIGRRSGSYTVFSGDES